MTCNLIFYFNIYDFTATSHDPLLYLILRVIACDHSSQPHQLCLAFPISSILLLPLSNMNQSLDAPFNSLAPAAMITLPAVSSAVADDSDIYVDPNLLDLDAIPPEELDTLIQKASYNSNRSLSTNIAASNPLASSNPSTLESLPCTTTSTPKPSSKPNPYGSHCCSSRAKFLLLDGIVISFPKPHSQVCTLHNYLLYSGSKI